VFEMDARLRGRWRFRGKPVRGADHGAVGEQLRRSGAQEFEAEGEVLECVPQRLLVWSWIANWHEHPAQPQVVRWDCLPVPAFSAAVDRQLAITPLIAGHRGREPVGDDFPVARHLEAA